MQKIKLFPVYFFSLFSIFFYLHPSFAAESLPILDCIIALGKLSHARLTYLNLTEGLLTLDDIQELGRYKDHLSELEKLLSTPRDSRRTISMREEIAGWLDEKAQLDPIVGMYGELEEVLGLLRESADNAQRARGPNLENKKKEIAELRSDALYLAEQLKVFLVESREDLENEKKNRSTRKPTNQAQKQQKKLKETTAPKKGFIFPLENPRGITFSRDDEFTGLFFNTGKVGKAPWSRYSRVVAQRLQTLAQIESFDKILNISSKTDTYRAGQEFSGYHSVRVDSQFRILFRWDKNRAVDVQVRDYHGE